jgi:hypothetical protein
MIHVVIFVTYIMEMLMVTVGAVVVLEVYQKKERKVGTGNYSYRSTIPCLTEWHFPQLALLFS